MSEKFNYSALERSIIDILQEFEIKLGYSKQSMHLFFPEKSLCNLLGCDTAALDGALGCFSKNAALGDVQFLREDDERYCALIPEESVAYVHDRFSDSGFLREFIDATLHCPKGIDDVLAVFRRYGDAKYEHIANGEFDYLVYFADGSPDSYRYCLKFGHGHASYHRFTKRDYEDFGF
jgi:hypothetical protein